MFIFIQRIFYDLLRRFHICFAHTQNRFAKAMKFSVSLIEFVAQHISALLCALPILLFQFCLILLDLVGQCLIKLPQKFIIRVADNISVICCFQNFFDLTEFSPDNIYFILQIIDVIFLRLHACTAV